MALLHGLHRFFQPTPKKRGSLRRGPFLATKMKKPLSKIAKIFSVGG